MKIIIINGSARKGNTLTAIEAFVKGASGKHEIEVIDAAWMKIAGCKGCGVCQCTNGCIDKDDTNPVIDKLVAADMIVFATPVYWWGMTAQLKLVIDKCFCRSMQLNGKKVGILVVGAAPVEDMQYKLISTQFDCIAKHLSWEVVFQKSYQAWDRGELEKQVEAMAELEKMGENL